MRLILIPLIFFCCNLSAQTVISKITENPIGESLIHLTQTPAEIKNDKLINQLVVDIVEPYMVDSVFKRTNQRHRVYGLGAMISVFGYKWRSIDNRKEKVVGVVYRHVTRPAEDRGKFTEYDINYDVKPYLPRYVDLAYNAYQRQLKYKRNKKKKDTSSPPYIYPDENTDMRAFRFHNELTPHPEFRTALNTMFYPVHRGTKIEEHPNFLDKEPVMGFYGPLVLDCNHSCHPEIHPYEWIWWYNTTENRENTHSWWIGLFRENSNRFKNWSKHARTGVISIPFVFPLASSDWTLHIEHQLMNGFDAEEFKKLSLGDAFSYFDNTSFSFSFNHPALTSKSLALESNIVLPYKAIGFELGEFNLDAEKQLVSGTLYLAMSVYDVYTAKVSTSFK